jgi:RHS repeat-associated protein
LRNPYGPLKQYDRMDVISGSPLRMRLDYNLAYRPTSVTLEGQTVGGPYYKLTLAEDAKGRITKRDYYPSDPQMTGVFDSYFLYDHQDHVVCETTSPVSTCPSTGSNIVKNSHPMGLTGAGDRTTLLRPSPGSGSEMSHVFGIAWDGHRIGRVDQSLLGRMDYTHDGRRNRISESNSGPLTTNATRWYGYDGRGNVKSVSGSYLVGTKWHRYTVRSGFDSRNRRVFKSFEDHGDVDLPPQPRELKRWYFYYDALDRLTEVRYIPDVSAQSIFTTYQLFWLENLLTAYWQTESPSGTTTKRYVATDETGRPVRMHSWETGNSRVVWAINPDAWGMDRTVIGHDVYQPILFAGQYIDRETASYLNDGVTMYRPGLVLNGFRTYDPFTGSYLQPDPLVAQTWNAYGYADGNPVGKIDPYGLKPREQRGETVRIRYLFWGWVHMMEPSFGLGLLAHFGGFGPTGDGRDGGPDPEPPAPTEPTEKKPIGSDDPSYCSDHFDLGKARREYDQKTEGPGFGAAVSFVTTAASTVISCLATPFVPPAGSLCGLGLVGTVAQGGQFNGMSELIDRYTPGKLSPAGTDLAETLAKHQKCMFKPRK